MYHCVTSHQNIFLSLWNIGTLLCTLPAFHFRFPISVLHHGGAKYKLPQNRKVNGFPRKRWAWLSGTSITVSTKAEQLSQSHASAWKRTHSVRNGMTNPFSRDSGGLPKNVLFTTRRLNRKCTAFPQGSAENEFPMSGGTQSGACVFLAITVSQSRRDQ